MSESSPALAGSAQRNQRLALVAVVGVAVLGVIAYLLLFSGGSKSSNTGATPRHTPTAAVASASPTAVQAVPAAYTAAVGRNPFQPALIPPTPPASATAKASTKASVAATPTPTPSPLIVIPTLTLAPTPTVTVTANPSPTVTVTATPTPTSLPTAGNAITLTLVRADATNTIDVTVTNGATTTPYNGITPGQVFGTYFKLVSILADTSGATPVYGADFEYGDQFLQLAKGQSAQLG
ncbi:MAG TPA: hypothetical protein VFG00_11220 [Acidothermaceae bacterium]|nr:hypothetical protein [Acidothermaceae bacterium]